MERQCYWCRRPILGTKVSMLGQIDGVNAEVALHPACSQMAIMKLTNELTKALAKENAVLVMKYKNPKP